MKARTPLGLHLPLDRVGIGSPFHVCPIVRTIRRALLVSVHLTHTNLHQSQTPFSMWIVICFYVIEMGMPSVHMVCCIVSSSKGRNCEASKMYKLWPLPNCVQCARTLSDMKKVYNPFYLCMFGLMQWTYQSYVHSRHVMFREVVGRGLGGEGLEGDCKKVECEESHFHLPEAHSTHT